MATTVKKSPPRKQKPPPVLHSPRRTRNGTNLASRFQTSPTLYSEVAATSSPEISPIPSKKSFTSSPNTSSNPQFSPNSSLSRTTTPQPTTRPTYTITISKIPPQYSTQKSLTQAIAKIPTIKYHSLILHRNNTATLKSYDPQIQKTTQALSHQIGFPLIITSPAPHSTRQPTVKSQTFSCVVRNVDPDITEADVTSFLKSVPHIIRVWRIKNRATGKDTSFMRILTSSSATLDHLLQNGVFMYSRRYRCEPSRPAPIPAVQCFKCQQFNHSADTCHASQTCPKCSGPHPLNKCPAKDPAQQPRCANCNGTHPAYSFKCPSRPKPEEITKPVPIKCIDPPTPQDVQIPKNIQKFIESKIDDLIRTHLAIWLGMFPLQRSQIEKISLPTFRKLLQRSVHIAYQGTNMHVSCAPTTETLV